MKDFSFQIKLVSFPLLDCSLLDYSIYIYIYNYIINIIADAINLFYFQRVHFF